MKPARYRLASKENDLRDLAAELDEIEQSLSPLLDEFGTNLRKSARRRGRPMTNREFEPKKETMRLWYGQMWVRWHVRRIRERIKSATIPPDEWVTQIRAGARVLLERRASFADRALSAVVEGQTGQLPRIKDTGKVRRLMETEFAKSGKYTKSSEAVGLELGLNPRWVREIVPKFSLCK